MYNKPGICLAVDELDAGIFEYLLVKKLLKDNFIPILISFEGIGDEVFNSEKAFIKAFINLMKKDLSFKSHHNKLKFVQSKIDNLDNFADLNNYLFEFVDQAEKKIVLMIDEVDKSSNNQLFLSFLGLLRDGFIKAQVDRDKTFYSVILSGVHDVKNLKLKLRDDEEHKYNSPWNIASEFKVDFELEIDQIASMLKDYQEDSDIDLDSDYFAEKIHYYTSGHPFLVSKLAEIIAEEILTENEISWQEQYLEQAVKMILEKDIPNFDTLIKNMENNSDLEEMAKDLLVDGKKITFNNYNPTIEKGILYGIFKNVKGSLKIHNKVYEQLIYNYLISKIENSMES